MQEQYAYSAHPATVRSGCGCGQLRAFPAPPAPGTPGPGQGGLFPTPPAPSPFPPPPFPGPGPGPGPGPFPPFPGPGPFPPFPGPGPFPPFPGPRFVTVVINGGRQFPWLTRSYSIRWSQGVTVRQALQATGVVQFGFGGGIVSVGGVYTGPGSNIREVIRLNGRVIPIGWLNVPIQWNDAIGLELHSF